MASPISDFGLLPSKIIARQSSSTEASGSALGMQQSSASQVLSTLAPTAIYSGLFFLLFLALRRLYPRLYNPRSFISSLAPSARTPGTPNGLVDWIGPYFSTPDSIVLNTQGTLDGYLFLRLLRVCVVICLVGVLITWPILLPVSVTGKGNQTQLNILTWSNVASTTDPDSFYRYYAHTLCAYIYFTFVIFMITRESIFYISLRQAYLVSPLYANRVSSRTVLFTAVPKKYLHEDALRELLGRDQVKHVWIPLDTDELEDKLATRDDMLSKLEGAEVDLIKVANAARNKALKEGEDIPLTDNGDNDYMNESGSVAARWIKAKDRPTHRLGKWGLWGSKVDSINWCRDRLPASIKEVRKLQDEHRAFQGKTRNSAFIEFHSLQDAQSAYQALTHHEPLHMAPRYIGMNPNEILWYNLRTKWWERIIRYIVSIAAVVGLVIGWTFPVVFIGSISKISYLVTIPGFSWLKFINNLGVVTGVITGLLPVVLLSVLMALLPIVLRLLARLGGDPTLSAVEYTVQATYFSFYVVQGFLVTTLSSGAIQAAAQIIKTPQYLVSLLANSLPEASNFYLAFFILQGLGVVSQLLLGAFTLVVYILLDRYLDNTPRKKFRRFVDLTFPSMGTVYPVYTTFLVIALSYSCIAPLVLGFATVGLLLFYLAYRYMFLYAYDIPYDSKGLMYARALQQIFVGIYLANLSMIGLLAIKLGDSLKVLGPLILMIIYLIATALFHLSLNTSLQPLLMYLPKTLETEERRLLAEEAEEDERADIEKGAADTAERHNSSSASSGEREVAQKTSTSPADKKLPKLPSKPKPKQANFIVKFFRPNKYSDYYTLRRLVPRDMEEVDYTEKEEREAYFHPSVTKEPDLLWIPQDEAGVSRQEVRHTGKVTPITDIGATLDAKGNILWDKSGAADVPIYKRRVLW